MACFLDYPDRQHFFRHYAYSQQYRFQRLARRPLRSSFIIHIFLLLEIKKPREIKIK